jgi:hypothetical protein
MIIHLVDGTYEFFERRRGDGTQCQNEQFSPAHVLRTAFAMVPRQQTHDDEANARRDD